MSDPKWKIRQRVLSAVVAERKSQDEKWGVRVGQPDLVWNAILGEEVGEIARALLERDHGNGTDEELADELVQVAAVAFAWLEALDGRGVNPSPGKDAS